MPPLYTSEWDLRRAGKGARPVLDGAARPKRPRRRVVDLEAQSFFFCEATEGGGGRALTMGNYMSKVRGRLLAAWVVWGARLRRGPGAPLTRRGVGPTLTYRGEARTTAQFINSTHLLVPSPVQRRSGRLPPRPPGPLRVLELCFGTASAMAAPLWGLHRRGVSPAGLLIPFFLFLLRAGRRVCLVCACQAGV